MSEDAYRQARQNVVVRLLSEAVRRLNELSREWKTNVDLSAEAGGHVLIPLVNDAYDEGAKAGYRAGFEMGSLAYEAGYIAGNRRAVEDVQRVLEQHQAQPYADGPGLHPDVRG